MASVADPRILKTKNFEVPRTERVRRVNCHVRSIRNDLSRSHKDTEMEENKIGLATEAKEITEEKICDSYF